ncbi:hypothetical protein H2198_003396 [Neophaeococcomyces mojaviensis]|uniref:Uncharacterized protein n=1 Tax=Neophaeococcomyces mojaviensis TaxID=3383035 RepID=A0ACC3ABF4_9EURO|nr:hypothetical protein H2198_003396 [Knufia sp. JES_112]
MHSFADIGGLTRAEVLDPPYRIVIFDDESAVRMFTSTLRLLWKLPFPPPIPPFPKPQSTTPVTLSPAQSNAPQTSVDIETPTLAGEAEPQADANTTTSTAAAAVQHPHSETRPPTLGNAYDAYGSLTHMSWPARAALLQSPNLPSKDDWQSIWRRQITYIWIHPFFDLHQYLFNLNQRSGHWVGPSQNADPRKTVTWFGEEVDSFAMFYSETGRGAVVVKEPRCNLILLPIFVDEGLKVSINRTNPGDAVRHLHTWDDNDEFCEAVYLRRGVEVEFSVHWKRVEELTKVAPSQEQEQELRGEHNDFTADPNPKLRERTGVAAVFVYAMLSQVCSGTHAHEHDDVP